MARRRRRSRRKSRLTRLIVAAAVLAAVLIAPRLYIHRCAGDRVCSRLSNVPRTRVALVLGAGVKPNGKLSIPLEERVEAGIALYKAGRVEKLLMSGDNRTSHYNEPMRMRNYAVKHGVPSEDVAMDFAGRRTYDSIYRAKHIFGLNRLVIVTHRFHQDRALFLCDHIGVKGIGFTADRGSGRSPRVEIRELGACCSALIDVYLRRPCTVMGPTEPI